MSIFPLLFLQSSQKAFEDHQDGIGASANELEDFGLGDFGDIVDGPGDDDLKDFNVSPPVNSQQFIILF